MSGEIRTGWKRPRVKPEEAPVPFETHDRLFGDAMKAGLTVDYLSAGGAGGEHGLPRFRVESASHPGRHYLTTPFTCNCPAYGYCKHRALIVALTNTGPEVCDRWPDGIEPTRFRPGDRVRVADRGSKSYGSIFTVLQVDDHGWVRVREGNAGGWIEGYRLSLEGSNADAIGAPEAGAREPVQVRQTAAR